jgi:thiol:disulfide interchange protein DsbD
MAFRLASILPACLLAVALPFRAGAQAPTRRTTAPHTTVELITAAETASSGMDLWVGVRFQLEHGWHIYWQNPGDGGSAPALAWQLPVSVRAGDIEWPAPSRIAAGTLVNYGYEGDVVLPVPLRVAPGAGGPVTLGLNLRWLICLDVCVPGRAQLALTLPLTPAAPGEVARWKSLIEHARARVPKPAPASWKARAVSDGDAFVLTIDTGASETQGVFFPLEAGQINDSAPQRIRAIARGLQLTLRKSDLLSSDPGYLKGVLSLSPDRTYVIVAPVSPSMSP